MNNSASFGRLLESVGLRVRRLRQVRGFTRRQLAEKSSISLRYLAQLEGGQANVSLSVMLKISECMGVDITEFIPAISKENSSSDPLQNLVQRLSPRERQFAYELLLEKLTTTVDKNHGIALIGLRGGGKSTLGKDLSQHFDIAFIRLGDVIRDMGAMNLGELFSLGGQTLYRRLEQQALQEVILNRDPVILETGGSLVMDDASWELLQRSFQTIWVHCSPEEHMQRVVDQGDMRPMSGNMEGAMQDLRTILEHRSMRYRAADHELNTSKKSIEDSTHEVIQLSKSYLKKVFRGQEKRVL